jgi:cytochrome P450
MRLYPAALGYVREAVQDVQLGEYLIPKGYMVIASNYILHRLPSVFPDPEQFDPERFSPEREPSIPRNVYQPFGAGPRICIGNHFAWMEGHLLLATLAQRIRFEIAEQGAGPLKIDSKHSLTYRPTQDIRLRVHTR